MSIIKYITLAAVFFAWPVIVSAQDSNFAACSEEFLCADYEIILERTLEFLDQEDGEAAFLELKALEACDKCPEHRDAIEGIKQ